MSENKVAVGVGVFLAIVTIALSGWMLLLQEQLLVLQENVNRASSDLDSKAGEALQRVMDEISKQGATIEEEFVEAGNRQKAEMVAAIRKELASRTGDSDKLLREIAELQKSIERLDDVSEPLLRKTGNNGTMSCNEFCAREDRGFEDGTGICISARIVGAAGDKYKAKQYVRCNEVPGLGYSMYCWCSLAS